MNSSSRPALGTLVFVVLALGLATYFTFAAVQGDFGIFRRAEIDAEADLLRKQLAEVQAQVMRLENLTKRLSDDYLDLDLLDEQTRRVLGMIRADEIVIR
ncbi:MAG: septum formation initiator family protein [Roseobacter sp.]|nr:septum formation initiator family protein [Roseobacter sp.]